MKKIIRVSDDNWARCGNCGHKLFKMRAGLNDRDSQIAVKVLGIEIKCHSCKLINEFGGRYDD